MHRFFIGSVVAITLIVGCTTPAANRSPSAPAPTVTKTVTQQAKPSVATPTVASATATPPKSSSKGGVQSDTLNACLKYRGHVYEVCTAYIANASLAVLVPYYKYANGSNDTLARYVTYRLGSRYSGQAYNTIRARVAQWPHGRMEVSVPDIQIVSAKSSLQTNTARLVTIESWKATTQNGTVVYREHHQRHVITMKRVPSYVLHKWVVTNIQ